MASIQGQGYATEKVKFNDDVQATISVKLINGDGEDPADVYGRISGRYGIGSEFVVFDRKQNRHIPVSPGKLIPLSRPEVDLPSHATNIEISAYLMDYDVISADDEIANGSVTFKVKPSGKSSTGTIIGQYGSVEVKVVWG